MEKKEIRDIFHEHKGRYGYRRMTQEMRNRKYIINHKTVQRIMTEMGLKSKIRKVRYHSYKGEVGKIAPNIIARDFAATEPNRKWATDVTYAEKFETPQAFIKALAEYIDYYNNKRIKLRKEPGSIPNSFYNKIIFINPSNFLGPIHKKTKRSKKNHILKKKANFAKYFHPREREPMKKQ